MVDGLYGRSTETKYARVPLWLFETGVSLQAVATYALLHGKYGHYEKKIPSYATLAKLLGVSRPSVIKYIKELREVGALAVVARHSDSGDQQSNEYVIAFNEPLPVVNMLTTSELGERAGGGQHADQGGQHSDHGGQNTDHGGQHADPIEDVLIEDVPKKTSPSSASPRARAGKRVEDDPLFAEFWAAYPRKRAKGDARKAWAQALKQGADPAVVIGAARRYAAERAGQDPRYTAYPATWLRGERYADATDPAYQPAPGDSRFRGGPHQPIPTHDDWNNGRVEVIL